MEETSAAVFILQDWIRLRHKIAKAKGDDAPPNALQTLSALKSQLGSMIHECDGASLSGVLEMYCRSRHAPRDVELTAMLLAKLREKGVMAGLWHEGAFVKLAEDADWGFNLTRLFSYGLMGAGGEEEVRAAVEMDL
ncbi:MAG: hypothetical protein LQ352_008427 [Teloschistes flavicans]|nr:MAG: hypothetical protein LQ352_008427 [Teloschistes flavicans]